MVLGRVTSVAVGECAPNARLQIARLQMVFPRSNARRDHGKGSMLELYRLSRNLTIHSQARAFVFCPLLD